MPRKRSVRPPKILIFYDVSAPHDRFGRYDLHDAIVFLWQRGTPPTGGETTRVCVDGQRRRPSLSSNHVHVCEMNRVAVAAVAAVAASVKFESWT